MIENIKRKVIDLASEDSKIARFILDLLGYGGHWTRRVMNDDIKLLLNNLTVSKLSVAEISGRHFSTIPWQSYLVLQYPEFDLCVDNIEYNSQFDLIFCEQVLEHVWQPQKVLINIHKMLKPKGLLIVSTPFLIKIHKCPKDYWRFTPDCMRKMLIEAGFQVETVKSWGNSDCVSANLSSGKWIRYNPFRSLKNDVDLPVVVWAFARKSG